MDDETYVRGRRWSCGWPQGCIEFLHAELQRVVAKNITDASTN